MTIDAGRFIPGTLCDARLFAPMLERLDVAAIHAPPIAHDNVRQAADAVLAIAPPRFVAIGFSLGGFVVLELLRRAANRLIGAVLIAGNAQPVQAEIAEARRAEVAIAREAGMAALIDRLWPSYVSPDKVARADLKRIVVDMAQDVGLQLYAKQAELAISRPDSRDIVTRSAVPLLSLCGTADVMSSPTRCGELATGPNASLIQLEGVGHFVPLEAPEAAADAVTSWMRKLAPCC